MKKLEFETSKGKFVVVDITENDKINVSRAGLDINGKFFSGANNIIKLSEITEQQASEIVASLVKNEKSVKSYVYTIHSLIKSKGYHLFENPIGNKDHTGHDARDIEWSEAEQKTFYNPVIFKIS